MFSYFIHWRRFVGSQVLGRFFAVLGGAKESQLKSKRYQKGTKAIQKGEGDTKIHKKVRTEKRRASD